MNDRSATSLRTGLMTLSNVLNFGSVLQTCATLRTVEKLGFSCTLIDYDYPTLWHINHAPGAENSSPLKKLAGKLGLLPFFRLIKQLAENRRSRKLHKLFREFFPTSALTPVLYDRRSILRTPPEFDIYMTGSDQTWNPRYLHTDYSFLLNFAPDHAPKIAYAASFGATELLPAYRESYRKYLQRYDRISVRETTGIPLVAELSGKEACCTPDPTLMLTRGEWEEITLQKLDLPEKFIFCYVLDYVFDPYPEVLELIDHLAALTGLPVVFYREKRIFSKKKYLFVERNIGPHGFLECFAQCTFAVTTSFHGTAFSVNFEKDFFTVLNPKNSKDDRVKSFLHSVGLENRGIILSGRDICAITAEDLKTDHSESRKHLAKMRQDSLAYLKEALNFAAQKCTSGEKNA